MLKYIAIIILALSIGNNAENVPENNLGTMPEKLIVTTCETKYGYRQEQERRYYTKMSTVLEVNNYDDSVIVVDEYGEMWEFYGAEDWAVADYCELIFSESGVPGYFWDDAIVGTIYKGVNEQFE